METKLETKLKKLLDVFEVPEDAQWLVETRQGILHFVKEVEEQWYFKRANTKYKWMHARSAQIEDMLVLDVVKRSVNIPNKNPATLSEQLNKTDEINLVLWGKQDQVCICKTSYPSQYSNVVANLSNHMNVDIYDGYLILSRKV